MYCKKYYVFILYNYNRFDDSNYLIGKKGEIFNSI